MYQNDIDLIPFMSQKLKIKHNHISKKYIRPSNMWAQTKHPTRGPGQCVDYYLCWHKITTIYVPKWGSFVLILRDLTHDIPCLLLSAYIIIFTVYILIRGPLLGLIMITTKGTSTNAKQICTSLRSIIPDPPIQKKQTNEGEKSRDFLALGHSSSFEVIWQISTNSF